MGIRQDHLLDAEFYPDNGTVRAAGMVQYLDGQFSEGLPGHHSADFTQDQEDAAEVFDQAGAFLGRGFREDRLGQDDLGLQAVQLAPENDPGMVFRDQDIAMQMRHMLGLFQVERARFKVDKPTRCRRGGRGDTGLAAGGRGRHRGRWSRPLADCDLALLKVFARRW